MESGLACFEDLLTAFFQENPGLDKIIIRGWTPGFNDGDPCTHSQDVIITPEDYADHGLDDEEYENGDEESDDPEAEIAAISSRRPNQKLDKKDAKKISGALYQFKSVLDQKYDTNWQLDIVRDSESEKLFKMSHDDYYCGH
jgi:hypothetical protein